jgi:uncharacterized Tic20 family protein
MDVAVNINDGQVLSEALILPLGSCKFIRARELNDTVTTESNLFQFSRNMLYSYLKQFRMHVNLYRYFIASQFIWDSTKDNLVLLPQQNKTRIYYNIVSCINFIYICLAIVSQLLLQGNSSNLETCILSFSFTILLMICGFLRVIYVEKPKDVMQLYNCMLLFEKHYPGENFLDIKL